MVKIAKIVGVKSVIVSNILYKYNWVYISDDYDFSHRKIRKMSTDRKPRVKKLDVPETTDENEVWKDIIIDGIDTGYDVSELGHLRSPLGYLIKGSSPDATSKKIKVVLKYNGIAKHKSLHQLVAMAFVENPDPINCTEVIHIDGDMLNNRADNLKYVTPSERAMHSASKKKDGGGKSKYDEALLYKAALMLYNGIDGKEVSRRTGISYNIIAEMRRGRCHTKIYNAVFLDADTIDLNKYDPEMLRSISELQMKGFNEYQIYAALKIKYPILTVKLVEQLNMGLLRASVEREGISKNTKNKERWSSDVIYKGINLGIRISSYGNLIHSKTGDMNFDIRISTGGYLYVNLKIPMSQKIIKCYLHDLVASIFIPQPDAKHCIVGFIDRYKTADVNVDNLRWMTPEEFSANCDPLEKEGTNHELPADTRELIIGDITTNMALSVSEIAIKYGVPTSSVRAIALEKKRKELKRTGNAVILHGLLNGEKCKTIAKKYGIPKEYVKYRKQVLRENKIIK